MPKSKKSDKKVKKNASPKRGIIKSKKISKKTIDNEKVVSFPQTISPWHKECTSHSIYDMYLATGRTRIWKISTTNFFFDDESKQSCDEKIKNNVITKENLICSWCKRVTSCISNMMYCRDCFNPENPFTLRTENSISSDGDPDYVFICKACFENHLEKTHGSKKLFESCEHCRVTYAKTFGKNPEKNPDYEALKKKYTEIETNDLIKLRLLPQPTTKIMDSNKRSKSPVY